jgi:hypothetical protein
MKQKHLFSLLDTSYTTVGVQFGRGAEKPQAKRPKFNPLDLSPEAIAEIKRAEQEKRNPQRPVWDPGAAEPSLFTYKVPRAWNVEEGDQLLVLAPQDGLKVVLVVRADKDPVIDVDADFDYRWAVQKVDLTEFQALTLREQEFGVQLQEIERVKQRESLMESFRNSLPEGSAARNLFEQTTAALQAPPPPPAPEAPFGGQVPPAAPQA